MSYIPITDQEKKEMLQSVGKPNMDALWQELLGDEPSPKLKGLPRPRSEYEVIRFIQELADRNAANLVSFIGSGFYDHFIPAAVDEVTSRSEFTTSYTPYQAEASQGTLQAIYEYQTAICRLTGMDVANASMYDGGTALFEAMMMAIRISRRRRAVLLGSVSPIYQEMIKCYCQNLDVELCVLSPEMLLNESEIDSALTADTACVMVQYPNVFGVVENYSRLTALAREKKVISICSTYPIALGLLQAPGEMGFDIVTGEGQSLGLPLSFGGPYLGFMASRKQLVRKMPGRICGRTVDKKGDTGFVLTLQAREQHIRREKATSNICTNQALCALRALAYLTFIGKSGLLQVAELCAAKAAFARNELLKIKGVTGYDVSFFNEFVLRLPCDAGEVVGRMIDRGFAAGFPLGRYYKNRKNELLVAVTEKRTREEIRCLAAAMEAVIIDL